jgi:hypothetical protein
MREANTIHQRRAVRTAQQSQRRRAGMVLRPFATGGDRWRSGGVLANAAGRADTERVYASDPSFYGLFRDTATEHLSSGSDSSRNRIEHEPGPDSNLDADSDREADGDGGDPVLWDQQPYWTVVRLASANRPGDGDANSPGVRDTDADVELHLHGQHLVDSRDRYGRERNLR